MRFFVDDHANFSVRALLPFSRIMAPRSLASKLLQAQLSLQDSASQQPYYSGPIAPFGGGNQTASCHCQHQHAPVPFSNASYQSQLILPPPQHQVNNVCAPTPKQQTDVVAFNDVSTLGKTLESIHEEIKKISDILHPNVSSMTSLTDHGRLQSNALKDLNDKLSQVISVQSDMLTCFKSMTVIHAASCLLGYCL